MLPMMPVIPAKVVGNGDVVTLYIATNIANIAASGASGSFDVNGHK